VKRRRPWAGIALGPMVPGRTLPISMRKNRPISEGQQQGRQVLAVLDEDRRLPRHSQHCRHLRLDSPPQVGCSQAPPMRLQAHIAGSGGLGRSRVRGRQAPQPDAPARSADRPEDLLHHVTARSPLCHCHQPNVPLVLGHPILPRFRPVAPLQWQEPVWGGCRQPAPGGQ
jgi:hypothetical protein